MDDNHIRHRPRHLSYTVTRTIEWEPEIAVSPADQPGVTAVCSDCGCVMVYRGLGRLHSGKLVHYFECVHSHREVHSLSIVVTG